MQERHDIEKTQKKIFAVIVAAGRGSRMGIDLPKQLLPYRSSTVLETTIEKFFANKRIDGIVVVSPTDGKLDDEYRRIAERMENEHRESAETEELGTGVFANYGIKIVRGGKSRGESVTCGLNAVRDIVNSSEITEKEVIVLVHDGARPDVSEEILDRNIDAISATDGVGIITAVPSVDSVRIIEDNLHSALNDKDDYHIINSKVVERSLVYNVQTPQTFVLDDIIKAYEFADKTAYEGTDDASVAERYGIKMRIVEGSLSNRKITTIEDMPMTVKVGTGYDVHRLVPRRPLVLCGTPVPYEQGLLGHSDADVATHALMDALLGAAGLGDIGKHFPDNDDEYKGISSLRLLAKVKDLIGEYKINNVDITIIAQEPKLSPYIESMKNNIANTLEISLSSVNIKATTEEGLGFTGTKQGIAAMAACSIEGRL